MQHSNMLIIFQVIILILSFPKIYLNKEDEIIEEIPPISVISEDVFNIKVHLDRKSKRMIDLESNLDFRSIS